RALSTGTADSVAARRYATLALQPAATIASTSRAGLSAATSHTKLATIVVMRSPMAIVVGTSCSRSKNSQNGAAVRTAVRNTTNPGRQPGDEPVLVNPGLAPGVSVSTKATVAVHAPPAGAGRIQASAGSAPAIARSVKGCSRPPVT